MLISKVNPLVVQTSEKINQPLEVTKDVIEYLFIYFREFIDNPQAAGIRFPVLGVFRPDYKRVIHSLKITIGLLRKETDPKKREALVNDFRILWKLKQLVKKDNERRKYKERFGSWHT